jgi:hypothetical protein
MKPLAVAPAPSVSAPAAEFDWKGATARGFMVQARVQAQSSLLSLGGGPGFLVGYHGPTFALGVGFGLSRLGYSSKDSNVGASASLLQIVPTLMVDVWRSADGRARANLVGGLGYERASVSTTSNSQTCIFDPRFGTNCSTTTNTDTAGATLIPVMVGIGGDYFLSRNFAIGAEAGVQTAFLVGADTSSTSGPSKDYNVSGDMEFGYGVIRATIVLGD